MRRCLLHKQRNVLCHVRICVRHNSPCGPKVKTTAEAAEENNLDSDQYLFKPTVRRHRNVSKTVYFNVSKDH